MFQCPLTQREWGGAGEKRERREKEKGREEESVCENERDRD